MIMSTVPVTSQCFFLSHFTLCVVANAVAATDVHMQQHSRLPLCDFLQNLLIFLASRLNDESNLEIRKRVIRTLIHILTEHITIKFSKHEE